MVRSFSFPIAFSVEAPLVTPSAGWLRGQKACGLSGFRAAGGHGASSTLTGPKCVGHDSSRQSAVETPSTSDSGTQNIQDNRVTKTVPNRRSCPHMRLHEWLVHNQGWLQLIDG